MIHTVIEMKSSVMSYTAGEMVLKEITADGSEELAQEEAKRDKVKEKPRERFRRTCIIPLI